MAVYQIYRCDHCGKDIDDNELKIYNGRFVGKDEKMMIQISMVVTGYQQPRYKTLLLCPACWKKVFRQVRKTLNLPEPDVKHDQP